MRTGVEIGKEAETRGIEYLRKHGYKILDTNYSTPFGEIDIIAGNKKDIVFVEVKFRSSRDFGNPEEFVSKEKQLKIVKTAIHYLKAKRLTQENVRFDILSIGPEVTRFELIESAFESPSFYKYM